MAPLCGRVKLILPKTAKGGVFAVTVVSPQLSVRTDSLLTTDYLRLTLQTLHPGSYKLIFAQVGDVCL